MGLEYIQNCTYFHLVLLKLLRKQGFEYIAKRVRGGKKFFRKGQNSVRGTLKLKGGGEETDYQLWLVLIYLIESY